MIDISINQLSKSFGATKIFEQLSMDIGQGERVGLIGPNGCGKTTLMKILTQEESYDEGNVAYRKGIRLGYLSQMPDYGDDMRVIDVMTLAFAGLQALQEAMADCELRMGELTGDALEAALSEYAQLTQRYESGGGYEVQQRLSVISAGLLLSESFKQQPFSQLSGGEKTRVELAKTLLESPDVLLLDEPSNHLDMTSIEWLEEFLKNYKGTAIIISHDRYFLDRVVNRILEMTFDKLIQYHGNYSYYVVEKERRFLLDMKYYENQQKKIKRMEDQIKRYRVWGAMRDSDKMYRKAKELEKRLSKVEKLERPRFDNAKVKFRFNGSDRSGKRVIGVTGLSKAFEEKKLFSSADLEIFYGESLCLVGDNGTGKSTLLRMMIHEACMDEDVAINYQDESDYPVVDSGDIKFGSRIKVGYLPQEVVFEDEQQTILDYFQRLHDLSGAEARRELARVLFVKDDVNKRIGTLSGGEKSRLKLCSLMYDKVNLMILDEPTNHLDIDSREILEETLIGFDGTIVFVSHDRYFIAKIANRMAEIQHQALGCYDGDYEYFREQKARQADSGRAYSVSAKTGSDTTKSPTGKIKTSNDKVPQKFRMEFENLEDHIGILEGRVNELQNQMAQASADAGELARLYEEELTLSGELQAKYERWEELTELYPQIQA